MAELLPAGAGPGLLHESCFFGTGTHAIRFGNNSTDETWFEAISNGQLSAGNT
jgi:hypothetical protein